MLIKLPQAAELLGVPTHRLKKWVQQGRIPVRRVGKAVYFHREVLENWARGEAACTGQR